MLAAADSTAIAHDRLRDVFVILADVAGITIAAPSTARVASERGFGIVMRLFQG